MAEQEARLEDFEVVQMLAERPGATVKLVQPKANKDMRRALKSVPINAEGADADELVREVNKQFGADSPSIVRFDGSFSENNAIHIKMEYMDQGSLLDLYQAAGPLPEKVLATIAAGALRGLAYLHNERKIIHRNIKPSNILLNHKGEVKLSDFGQSRKLDNAYSAARTYLGGITAHEKVQSCYMSPERVLATTYEYNTDIWSLGLSILEAAEGRFPYSEAKDEDDLLDMISENDPPTAPKGASNEFAEFINQCLKRHPKKRVQANDLIDEDSFVRRGMENPVDLAAFLAGVRERNPDYNKKFPLFN